MVHIVVDVRDAHRFTEQLRIDASSEEIVAVEEMTAVKAERGTTAEITTKTTKNKYNKSAIMRRAWELKRTTNDTFSVCLKKAWAEAKSAH